jgi:hypothetical protein
MRYAIPVLLLTGAGCVTGPLTTHSDAFEVSEPIHTIVVDSTSGDVSVRAGDAVTVERYAEWRGDTPDVSAEVQGGVLYLDDGCDGWGICSVEHVITAPADVQLDILVGSGDVEISGMKAGAAVETGSGDVRLQSLGGEALVIVGSGDVEGEDLSLRALECETGSGEVWLDYAVPPELTRIETGSGDVVLDLPEGIYDLDLQTGSGDIDIDDIDDSASSENKIYVSTGSGDIEIYGR